MGVLRLHRSSRRVLADCRPVVVEARLRLSSDVLAPHQSYSEVYIYVMYIHTHEVVVDISH